MSLDISNYFRHFLKIQHSLKFISIIDPILILSSPVFPPFNLLLGYHDSFVILLSLTMGSLKQLPHCRKCWSCICSLFYFSDITPSLLMSMNCRIRLRQDLFVQNPGRDVLPLCHKLSRNWVFFCTVSFEIQELLQKLFGNHRHRFTDQYHGSCIRYAPMFLGYNKKLVVFRSLYWKSCQLFSPSQTPVWPLPRPPPGVKIPSAGVLMSNLNHSLSSCDRSHEAQKRVRAQRSRWLPQGTGG